MRTPQSAGPRRGPSSRCEGAHTGTREGEIKILILPYSHPCDSSASFGYGGPHNITCTIITI